MLEKTEGVNQEWTIQRNWQQLGTQHTGQRLEKTEGVNQNSRMDNPEKLATTGYTRHRTKTNKTKNTTQKTNNMCWIPLYANKDKYRK